MRIIFTLIFLGISAGICFGEPSNSKEEKPVERDTQIAGEPDLPVNLDPSDETIETLFLAAYLNTKRIAEIIEVKEKNGKIYYDLEVIAALLESTRPVEAHKYATADWLALVFPAKFIYLDKLQALAIEGTGDLPIEKRWQRERRQKNLSYGKIAEDAPELKFDHQLFRPPSIDFSATYFGGEDNRFLYGFNAVSEALYGTMRLLGRGVDFDEVTDFRFSWERVERDWSLWVGDIVAPQDELLVQGESGRGFVYSNIPRDQATQFDSEVIEGNLDLGWGGWSCTGEMFFWISGKMTAPDGFDLIMSRC